MRLNFVWTILLQPPLGDSDVETDLLTDVEPLKSVIAREQVPIEFGDLFDVMVTILEWRLGGALLRLGHMNGQGPVHTISMAGTAHRGSVRTYLNSPTILLAVSPR